MRLGIITNLYTSHSYTGFLVFALACASRPLDHRDDLASGESQHKSAKERDHEGQSELLYPESLARAAQGLHSSTKGKSPRAKMWWHSAFFNVSSAVLQFCVSWRENWRVPQISVGSKLVLVLSRGLKQPSFGTFRELVLLRIG